MADADHTYIIKKDTNEKNLDLTLKGDHKKQLTLEQQKYNNKKMVTVENYATDSIDNYYIPVGKPKRIEQMKANKRMAFTTLIE